MDKIQEILKRLGDSIVRDARVNLKARKKDKNSSGNLSRSLKSDVVDTTLTIYGADYANYVDGGTRYFKGNEYLIDSVDYNLEKYGTEMAEQISEDFLVDIKIILD